MCTVCIMSSVCVCVHMCVCVGCTKINIYFHLFFFVQVHNATADVQLYILFYYSL